MLKPRHLHLVVAATAFALCSACLPVHAAQHAAAVAKTVEVVRPVGEAVAYEALEHHIGAEIAVETTLNTVRRGKLVKYTNPALTLQLGPEAGSIELSVPRETVRSIRLLPSTVPAQPEPGAKPEQGAKQESR
ncbi:hypothetical protein [Dokdonella soli]|uniref:Uncharacterized protein n=1 Tax=Dokdonella soli TaxID=529810 RepID=A0ABN1IBB6_9GAMM